MSLHLALADLIYLIISVKTFKLILCEVVHEELCPHLEVTNYT